MILRRLALFALLSFACDGSPALAAPPPSGSVQAVKVITCDGVETGTTNLTTVTVTGFPNYATQAWVESVGDWYTLLPDDGTALQYLVHVAASDGRRWHRQGRPNAAFLAAAYWSVGLGGSDENRGWGPNHAFSDAVRLATMSELNRRLAGYDGNYPGWFSIEWGISGYSGPSIHITSDIPVTSFAVLTNMRAINGNTLPRIYGDLTQVDGSATNRAITAAQPAVPVSNTERTITIAGLGLVPQYVTKAVISSDGRKFAWVTRQTVSDTIAISQPQKLGPGEDWVKGDTGTIVGADFIVGDHVGFYDMAQMPDWPFPSSDSAESFIVHVHLGNNTSAYSAHGDLGTSGVFIYQCVWGYPGFRASYQFAGGLADSSGPGVILQPLFLGTHNVVRNVAWILNSPTSIATDVAPYWNNSSLQITGELNITGGLFKAPSHIDFPAQNIGAIAMFGITYPYGAFQFTPTDHHGGGPISFYMNDGVVWYGHIAGAAMSLPQGSVVRLPVNTIYLDAPGSSAPGGIPVGSGQIFIGSGSGVGTDPQLAYKNFSNVPFFDAPTGTSISGHQ